MPAEWLSGHILDRGNDAREHYSYSFEGQNELLQFLKAIRPEWSFPKKSGKSHVRSVMEKLRAVGVTTVWELFRAVMRNSINEDLAQKGYSVLSKETLDRIRKRMSFFRQLDVLTETDCRQIGAFAPVPQLLSQKKLAFWSKTATSEPPRSPERRRASTSQGRRSSGRGSRGSLPREAFAPELSRPRLRGARGAPGGPVEVPEVVEEKEPLKSSLRPAMARTWQAGDSRATGSTLESTERPKAGLLREASQVSMEESEITMTRTRLGSGTSSFLFMSAPQRARGISVDHSSTGQQDNDTLLATVVKLQQEAASMQDFRPPAWSVLRRNEHALIDGGQAMLDEQQALLERANLLKLMEQEGLHSPMRQHVAENVRSRLKEESDKVAAEGLEMQHKCTNIRKNLGQMMNARRDLAALRRAIVGRLEVDEQLKPNLLSMERPF